MRSLKSAVLLIFLLLSLPSCISAIKAPAEQDKKAKSFAPPPEGLAGLYIFRDSRAGQNIKKAIHLNGVLLARSAPDVYFYKEIKPGTHLLTVKSIFGNNELIFNAKANNNYFVENYIESGLLFSGSNLKEVEPYEAMQRIKLLDLAENF